MKQLWSNWRKRRSLVAVLKESRHFMALRGDVIDPALLNQLRQSTDRLCDAVKRKQWAEATEAACDCSLLLGKGYRPRRFPRLRENVEVLVVALAVAMGFRTYFLQPFKIPTGSMQPTLYGITVSPAQTPNWTDRFPWNLVKLALFGERFVTVRARVGGIVSTTQVEFDIRTRELIFHIAGLPHKIHQNMTRHFELGQYVRRGQILATGRVRYGDHVFVDKIAYNARRPRRGEIVVFNTDNIIYPGVLTNTFYIKRLVGLPGEQISLSPPYLMVNGQIITEPPVFTGRLTRVDLDYCGYQLPRQIPGAPRPRLASTADKLQLGDTEYLLMGDNSRQSLDGRYFGPVKREMLVGPAVLVYWPLSRRWGPVSWSR